MPRLNYPRHLHAYCSGPEPTPIVRRLNNEYSCCRKFSFPYFFYVSSLSSLSLTSSPLSLTEMDVAKQRALVRVLAAVRKNEEE